MAGDVVRLLGEIFRFGSTAPRTYFNGDLALWPIRRDLGRGLVRMSYQTHPIICCCENGRYRVQVRLRSYLHELANAGFWQKRPAVAAAEGLLTEAALKHACTEPLVLAQKSGCYALADVFAPKPAICVSPAGAADPQQATGRAGVARVASALGQTAASRTHSYDQSAANRCSSTQTPKRKPS
jgi:hypothetical protein